VYVRVHSIEAGSEVTVTSGHLQIGLANANGGSVNVKLNRPLTTTDVLTAASAKGGQTSKAAAKVKVQQLPSPLPTPICLATPYAGAKCLYTWGMVPGCKVTAVSGNDLLGVETAITGAAMVRLARPLTCQTGNFFKITIG
jgi:hypothetical protein